MRTRGERPIERALTACPEASPLWPLVLLLGEIATRVECEQAAPPPADDAAARQPTPPPRNNGAAGVGRNPPPAAPRRVTRQC